MEKIRYETDPFNRLVITDKKSVLPRHRKSIEGVFSMGKGNSLLYRVKSPLQDGALLPYQTQLRGRWSLNENHDLCFTMDRWRRGEGSGELTLAGEIIEARGDSILFAVTTKSGERGRITYVLELTGTWAADKNNRLTFSVKRQQGMSDTLTFNAAWDVDKDNEVVYRYEKISRGSGIKKLHELRFKGFWRVTDKARLSYLLEGYSNSSFNFRTAMGICGADYIKYEIGVGLSRHLRPRIATIVIYGIWRISEGTGVIFETEYAGRRVYSMAFSASVRITGRDSVVFKLRDPAGKKDLGLEIELKREMLECNGSAFMRFLKSTEESALLIGGALRW